MDVFTMVKYREFQELKTWKIYEGGGFWSSEKYLELHDRYHFSDNVTLEQTAVVTKNTITPYYIWNRYFTTEALIKEVREAGFENYELFGDVAGSVYEDASPTMAILLVK